MKHKQSNPFVVGRYIDSYYFCDREEETSFLKKTIENGRDIAIISPRRLGKTGLIEHFFATETIKSTYHTIFIDIYATSSIEEMISTLGHAVFREIVMKRRSGWKKFIEAVSSLRPSISVDPISGEPSLNITARQLNEPELTLSEIFDYLESSDRGCIVAIDEFQEIATYTGGKTEALLRTYVQKAKNTRFIFAGSSESMMNLIFNSPTKPFYQSVLTYPLKPIPQNKYVEFAMQRFSDYGKTGDISTIEEIYSRMSGITWFIQMIMNELFAITEAGGTLSRDMIDKAEENIIGMQEYSYREIMSRLTSKQRELVYYLACKRSVENILSGDSLKESGFSTASSLQAALNRLHKDGIISREGSSTFLYDMFFMRWLRKQRGL